MTDVAVFFFRPTLGGGTTTFTAHLMAALTAAGSCPRLYRVETGARKPRPFGEYGFDIETVDVATARKIVKHTPSVLSAPGSAKFQPRPDLLMYLAKAGMRCVVHDPKEFSAYSGVPWQPPKFPQPPICIRPTLREYVHDAVYIRHPYRRSLMKPRERTKKGISTARIHSSKRPAMIIEANSILPKRLRIEMLGTEYRMYSYGLAKKWAGVFAQKKGAFAYPLSFDAPFLVNSESHYNFDMSWFETDGGGTQYCQLEAMDAGCVPVMHEDWFRYRGSMSKRNAMTVSSSGDIAYMMRNFDVHTAERDCIRETNLALLEHHNPSKIGRQFIRELLK